MDDDAGPSLGSRRLLGLALVGGVVVAALLFGGVRAAPRDDVSAEPVAALGSRLYSVDPDTLIRDLRAAAGLELAGADASISLRAWLEGLSEWAA